MSILLALSSAAEIRSAVLCTSDGLLEEAIGDDLDAEQLSATIGFISFQLAAVGAALKLGSFVKLVAPGHNLLLVAHDSKVMALYLQNEATLMQAEAFLDHSASGFNNDSNALSVTEESTTLQKSSSASTKRVQATQSPHPALSSPNANPNANNESSLSPQVFTELQRQVRVLIDSKGDLAQLFKKNGAKIRQWLAIADARIVELLADEAISEAEELVQLVCPLLREREKHGASSPKESSSYSESIDAILCGLRTFQIGDLSTSISCFKGITDKSAAHPSHRWLASFWLVKALIASGDLDLALQQAELTLGISTGLSSFTSFFSHLLVGNLRLLSASPKTALEHAEQAKPLATSEDRSAQVLLLSAKARLELGQVSESMLLAEQAHEMAPSWPDPCDFLVKQAIAENKLWLASSLLTPAEPSDPAQQRSTERSQYVVSAIQTGSISNEGALQYLSLKDAVAVDNTIEQLQALVASYPDFIVARETLAWKMLNRGRGQQALAILTELSRNELPPFVEASVSLGLSCVAVAHDGHAHPEARIHALRRKHPGDESQTPFPDSPTPIGVFAGELSHFPLPDLLEFFNIRRRTGTIVINTSKGSGAISLREGRITAATSPNCDSLGKLLLKQSTITSDQLAKALAIQRKEPDRLMGSILVKLGYVSEEIIRNNLTNQILHSVRELVENQDGDFAFDPADGEVRIDNDLDLSLDTQFVLLEIFRTIDEENR